MKNKIKAVGTIFVSIAVLLVIFSALISLLIRSGNGIWQIFSNPSRLANMAKELLDVIGSLGLCCVGIILLVIIVGNLPQKWMYGGRDSSDDDDDDPYYRYM